MVIIIISSVLFCLFITFKEIPKTYTKRNTISLVTAVHVLYCRRIIHVNFGAWNPKTVFFMHLSLHVCKTYLWRLMSEGANLEDLNPMYMYIYIYIFLSFKVNFPEFIYLGVQVGFAIQGNAQ